jgi:NAD(P)-dependent dehydrogenase (short-subunit alcohol dehydrogenase family)
MASTSANPFALEDQTVLIAGAANGIGASAAAACAALGAELVFAGGGWSPRPAPSTR